MRFAIACALGLATTVAHAQPGPDRVQPPGLTEAQPTSSPDTSRNTDRLMVGVVGGAFASYPMSIGGPGVAVVASMPVWLGHRYRFFQWVAAADAVLGVGPAERNGYVIAGPSFGFNLYLGSVFGFEVREGLAGMGQLGERTVGGLVFTGNGGYVFRLWKDDRKRLKLYMTLAFGAYFADDPGNDTPLNAGVFGVGLAYERPL
jgi:hypothetical protein